MLKRFKVAVILCSLLVATGGTAKALELDTVTVYVSDDGEIAKAYETTATTIEEFITEQDINLGEYDLIDVDLNSGIEYDMNFTITRAVPVNVIINNDISTGIYVKTTKDTVKDFIKDYKEETGMEYIYEVSNDKNITPYMEINLTTKTEQVTTEEVEIPYTVQIIETDDLLEGEEEVVQNGSNGAKLVKIRTYYEGEQEIDSEVFSELTLSEVQDHIVRRGTAKAVLTADGYKRYSQHITMSATAYCSSYSCTGKNPGDRYYGVTSSGMKAAEGIVAVDPNVIPLGTKLYIEGYGIAIAGDTGGAIKGNKIDLFFENESTVKNFGRQAKEVYILE